MTRCLDWASSGDVHTRLVPEVLQAVLALGVSVPPILFGFNAGEVRGGLPAAALHGEHFGMHPPLLWWVRGICVVLASTGNLYLSAPQCS